MFFVVGSWRGVQIILTLLHPLDRRTSNRQPTDRKQHPNITTITNTQTARHSKHKPTNQINMPRFFDDYSNTYLTHDSAAGRKQQRRGWKFRENFKLHYKKKLEEWQSGEMGLAAAQQAFIRNCGPNPNPNDVPPLPQGWREEHDEATRLTFYLNEETNERAWARPGFFPPGPAGGGMRNMNAGMGMNMNGNSNMNMNRGGPPPPMMNMGGQHRGPPPPMNNMHGNGGGRGPPPPMNRGPPPPMNFQGGPPPPVPGIGVNGGSGGPPPPMFVPPPTLPPPGLPPRGPAMRQ